MAIRIQRNTNGSFKNNRAAHTADVFCDVCGHARAAVNLNTVATYGHNLSGVRTSITLTCTAIGGSCTSSTSWPLVNGTADAVELALVKTA